MFLNQARTRRKVRYFHFILARQLCLKWLLRLLACQEFWSWILEPRPADFLEKHLQVTHMSHGQVVFSRISKTIMSFQSREMSNTSLSGKARGGPAEILPHNPPQQRKFRKISQVWSVQQGLDAEPQGKNLQSCTQQTNPNKPEQY